MKDLDIISNNPEKCQECLLNKCTRTNHPSRTTAKAKVAGNNLHLDTAGPSNVPSRSNLKYLLLCKDECSRYRWAAFVSSKSQIPNDVKEFISKTTLETGNQVLKIVTDNGIEFVNNDLLKFLSNKGIIHEKSVSYTSAQNGFIERDIRTIKESAKTMLNDSGLSKDLWPGAINCAVYTSNRVINSSNKMKTPYELWFGSVPCVKNLRRFGEEVILKKPEGQLKSSWDRRGVKALFIGYTDRTNTYRFLVNDIIVISCDAIFTNNIPNDIAYPISNAENNENWVTVDTMMRLWLQIVVHRIQISPSVKTKQT